MNKWLHLKAYNTYDQSEVYIEFEEDEIDNQSYSSKLSSAKIWMYVSWTKENPEIKRWSDLKDIQIITKEEYENFLDSKK